MYYHFVIGKKNDIVGLEALGISIGIHSGLDLQ